MSERYTPEKIREYWEKSALKYTQSSAASWSDKWAIHLEVKELCCYLKGGDKVLDAGCSNGHATIEYAKKTKINITGIDYIPEMIQNADIKLNSIRNSLLGNVKFRVGDITSIDEPSGVYDKVIVSRVLINLNESDLQLQCIVELARILKQGGLLLLSEASLQGWRQMNSLRQSFGFKDIPMPSFNYYLDEDLLINQTNSSLKLEKIINYSSTYYIGTRIFKPILFKAIGKEKDIANPDSRINYLFAHLPSYGDYGTQKLFVFRKI